MVADRATTPSVSALADISNSPAYAHLDDLAANNKLSEEQVIQFKSQYAHLHEVVLGTYENEKKLLTKARQLNKHLRDNKGELDQQAKQITEQNKGIEELKNLLDTSSVEVSSLGDESSMLNYEIEELERNKLEITADLNQRRKENDAMIEPTLSRLRESIAETKSELTKQLEVEKKEAKQHKMYDERLIAVKAEIEELEKKKLTKRQDLNRTRLGPDRLRAQIEVASKACASIERQSHHLSQEIKRLEAEEETTILSKKKNAAALLKLTYNSETIRADTWKSERAVADIRRLLEQEKLKNAEALERKLELEHKRQTLRLASRHSQDNLIRLSRQMDEQKRQYERIRRKNDLCVDSLDPIRAGVANEAHRLKVVKDQQNQQSKVLKQLTQDVDIFISQYLKEETMDKNAMAKLKEYGEINANLEEALRQSVKQERELKTMIRELTGSREVIARDSSRATVLLRDTKNELAIKELVIVDLNKKLVELKGRITSTSQLYELIKNQRNKFANLTQTSTQELAEMKEKIRILQNEVEILRSESTAKERSLKDEARVLQTAQSTRDALRSEQTEANTRAREVKANEARQLVEIQKLNSVISSAEKEMTRLRNDYIRAVNQRNHTGMQLIDRNDELCILNEKSNIFESLLKRGERQLAEYDDRSRRTSIEVTEIEWKIRSSNLKIPSAEESRLLKRRLNDTKNALQNERSRIVELSEILETPSLRFKESRHRRLEGEDPDKAYLASKIEALQENLNDKKEQLLEKNLVLEEVGCLSDQLRTQAAEGQTDTLLLAKSMNALQANLRSITRKMMATVSELSMYQATAMKLEQEKHSKEEELKTAHNMLEQGLPPSESAEHEWYRMERERSRRQQELVQSTKNTNTDSESSNEQRTTAEARPNAYMPDTLGIPRPYGANAPFKPSIQGSSMRHIQKPCHQEIII